MVNIKEEFEKHYQKKPDCIFFSPGRVNLIGEHIDYNGGQVMPCALNLGTYLAVARNSDNIFRFQCLNFPETADITLQSSYARQGNEWYNYPLGVIDFYLNQNHSLAGLDMLFYGNLPIGAGLSSSASLEVLTAFSLSEIFALNVPRLDIALLSKKVENDFMKVNSGIMDQFAVTFGRKNRAILLNCDTLAYKMLSFNVGENVLAIINTNKSRKLTESKYNERFAECREALKRIKIKMNVQHLCDLTPSEFESLKYLINDTVLENRAEHVVMENGRVLQAADALENGRLEEFGQLMFASHDSLKRLYDVSGKELDTIVEFSAEFDGCQGARMTGAGFGGCAIALVDKMRFSSYSNELAHYYEEKVGYAPAIFACEIGDGVREIE